MRAVTFWLLFLAGGGGLSLASGGLLRAYNDVLAS
jgi:hypothetical protein